MNNRTKLLAIGAAAVFLLYGLDSGYRSFVEQPTRELSGTLERLEQDLRSTESTQLKAKKDSRRLDVYSARALPSDPELARSDYQDWLLRLVEKHHLASASVDAANPIPVELPSRVTKRKRRLIGHRIALTVHAQSTLSRLSEMLFEFHNAPHLHKIRNLALTPLGNGSELDINLSVEVLSLRSSDRTETLSDWEVDPKMAESPSTFEPLVKRNFFARGLSKSLADVRLRAITVNRQGESEAWFSLGNPARTQIVSEGQALELPAHQLMVEEIEEDQVKLNVNQISHWINLGQSLGDLFSRDSKQSDDNGADRSNSVSTTNAAVAPPVVEQENK